MRKGLTATDVLIVAGTGAAAVGGLRYADATIGELGNAAGEKTVQLVTSALTPAPKPPTP